jgi:CelD/BcsL family acetyltransferase involved in cellulose biosynthesis
MQLEKIRWLCEEGVSRYDMGPLMDYKRHWTEKKAVVETRVLMRK